VAYTSTYLNFDRETEAAFEFYKSVFGTDYPAPILRYSGMPASPGDPETAEADRDLVMHVQLPITGGHVLMGSDAPSSLGHSLTVGNNVYISVHPDTRAEADRLFAAMADGGNVEMPMADQFWGDYFGSLVDRFGVRWMVNCSERA